ncbi:hypothetical protein DPMN_109851 [Dreissena polymorpha]|uniref:Uncharacterized protein n=1 Tax=Dreissena polymorpha TaxID=45954 RepID=A0A9D4KBB6_DREPO|nr:hypothetical protein DPMN_109851 [Dreissena polymorpha]
MSQASDDELELTFLSINELLSAAHNKPYLRWISGLSALIFPNDRGIDDVDADAASVDDDDDDDDGDAYDDAFILFHIHSNSWPTSLNERIRCHETLKVTSCSNEN